jgi:uncharacterized protein involved in exopolysaccharide biosynthesis
MSTEMPNSEATQSGNAPLAEPEVVNGRAQRDDTSLLDLLVILSERKRVILQITAVFTVVAIVVSLLLPVRYTATVILLPPQQNSSIATALASQLGNLGSVASLAGGGGSFGLKNPNDMYVAMLQSRTVEDAMVKRFELMREYRKKYLSDARKAFEKHATIDGNGKDSLIHISFEDHDPNRAAAIANAYVDEFRNLSQSLAITEASQRRVFFEHELEKSKNDLADAEEALKRTEQKTGLIQLDSQARALIESAATLRAEITAREVQIQGMQTYATGENAQLVQAQRELDGLRAQLAKMGGSEEGGSGEFLVPKGLVPEAGLEYARKLRDVKYYETIFGIIARQFEIAKLDEAKEGAIVQVVDPAIPPDRRSFPKRSLITLGACIGGFLVGVCVALFQAGLLRLKADRETSAKLAYVKSNLRLRRSPPESVRSPE